MNERLIKKLVTVVKCSACGEHYQLGNIKIVGHQDDTWFINVSCPACHRQSLVVAVITKDKTQNIINDLTEAELIKFAQRNTINTDDILDLHDFLKDFDGDFNKIFSQK